MAKILYCLKIRKYVTRQIEYFWVWKTVNLKGAFDAYSGTTHKSSARQVGIVVVLLAV